LEKLILVSKLENEREGTLSLPELLNSLKEGNLFEILGDLIDV